MANNPYVNKVVYGNDVVMDITDTTAEAADVASGKKFYDKSGAPTLGTGTGGNVEWGDIGGTLSDQTDLQAALDGKQSKTLEVPIEMLSGTKLTVESALQGLNAEKSTSIELSPSEYDVLPTEEKEDPSKIYFIHEDSTWSGLTSFVGNNTWTDGTNIYYSNGSSKQYVLDKETSTWNPKTWNGLTDIYKDNIWTDGTDVYYSNGNGDNYVLDKSTSTWNTKTWSGYSSIEGENIWTDGTSIYYSSGYTQYELNTATSTWIAKTWNNINTFYGKDIWTDGTNVYLSYDYAQYVLSIATSTWSTKTWNGITRFYATYIWTDGTNIFYSVGSAQYVLDKSTSTWIVKTWSGLTEFYATYIWTDETSIYYSYGTNQYRLDGIEWTTDINANDCNLIRYKNGKYGEKTEINDTVTASDKVWSSQKVATELAKKYDENDTAETDIADDDYFPFYDTSDTAKKKSLWSNIKDKLSAIFTLLSIVGTVENGTTASQPYNIGDHFIRDGKFCTVITSIAQGALLTLDTNYREGNVANLYPRYIPVKASSANVTYATALAELQTAYSNMTSSERINSRLRRAYYIYNISNTNASSGGIYTSVGLDGNNYTNFYQLNIMGATYMTGKTNAVVADKSNNSIGSNPLILEVLHSLTL